MEHKAPNRAQKLTIERLSKSKACFNLKLKSWSSVLGPKRISFKTTLAALALISFCFFFCSYDIARIKIEDAPDPINDFVDELEVFIFNRWGELIFYCEQKNISADTFVCSWDGTVNGTYVPIGVYPVVVNFKSNNQNVTNKITKSILVIE